MLNHYKNRHINIPFHPYFKHMDPKCVRVLNHLVKCVNAEVVISSSWRRENDNLCERTLKATGFLYCDKIIGQTPRFWDKRGYEIWYWLKNNLDKWDRFIILDDDSDMEFLKPFHLKINRWNGLQNFHIKKIVNILNFHDYNKTSMINNFKLDTKYLTLEKNYDVKNKKS